MRLRDMEAYMNRRKNKIKMTRKTNKLVTITTFLSCLLLISNFVNAQKVLGYQNAPNQISNHSTDCNIPLDSLRKSLYSNFNLYYVLVDVYRLGLVKANEPYDIGYHKKQFSVNGKALPSDLQKKFNADIDTLFAHIPNEIPSNLREFDLAGRGKLLNCIGSVTVYTNPMSQILQINNGYKTDLHYNLIELLKKDGLAKPNHNIRFAYSSSGLIIGNQKLSSESEKAYTPFIQIILGTKPTNPTENLSFILDVNEINFYLNYFME